MNNTNDLAPRFKITELGPLPEEWQVVRLAEVVQDSFSGGTPSTTIPQYWNGDIPWTTSATIDENAIFLSAFQRQISQLALRHSATKIAPKGCLVVATRVGIGKAVVPKINIAISQDLAALTLNYDIVDATFLALMFKSNICRASITAITRGTTIKGVPRKDLLGFLLPLPPLAEQRAIAYALRTVHHAGEATERVIAALKELKRSLMRHLFTYGPVPVGETGSVPLRESEIGPIPAHWQVVRLGEVFHIQQGKSLSPRSRSGDCMRPFLRTANVLWGRIDLGTLDSMHFEEEEEQRLALRAGDLLVCEGGNIGRTAIWNGQIHPCYYQNHLHRLRAIRSGVNPLFYMYWMETAWTLLNLYSGAGNKTTIPNLSRSRLASLLIPLPPLREQHEIARILQAVDAKIAAEEKRKEALRALFKTSLAHLMTARVRLPSAFVASFQEPPDVPRE